MKGPPIPEDRTARFGIDLDQINPLSANTLYTVVMSKITARYQF